MMTEVMVRGRANHQVVDEHAPIYYLDGEVYTTVLLLAVKSKDLLAGKYLSDAFEGGPEGLTTEEQDTLDHQTQVVQNVGRLSYGKECHEQFSKYLRDPNNTSNPRFWSEVSEAVSLVWWLGFDQATRENDQFLSDWVMPEEGVIYSAEEEAGRQAVRDSISLAHQVQA